MRRQPQHGQVPPEKYVLRVNNTSGSTVPAYGILTLVDASNTDDDGNYDVDQPDDSTAKAYWINAPLDIPAGEKGAATNRFPCIAAYDEADPNDPPSPGEEWGPKAGSWLLASSGTGFRILGGAADGLVRIEKIGGGGGVHYTAHIATNISAGSASAMTSGSATIYRVESDGTTTSLGSKTLFNPYEMVAKGECACEHIAGDNYIIEGLPLLLTIELVLTATDLTVKLKNHGDVISSSSVPVGACV